MPNKCFLKNTEGGGLKNFTSEKKKVFSEPRVWTPTNETPMRSIRFPTKTGIGNIEKILKQRMTFFAETTAHIYLLETAGNWTWIMRPRAKSEFLLLDHSKTRQNGGWNELSFQGDLSFCWLKTVHRWIVLTYDEFFQR